MSEHVTGNQVRSEPEAVYKLPGHFDADNVIIAQALVILATRMKRGAVLSSPQAVRDFLCATSCA